ncbi:MAG: hypothetical protein PHG51_07725, partial [Candidatus Omnitrophica bacterium]|nr:hypothetical protein [Candidatus Omnitrophota bacterium]
GSWPKGKERPEVKLFLASYGTGHVPWNKGLNKEKAKLIGKRLGGCSVLGRTPWNKGKTGVFSEDALKKISEGSKRWKRSSVHLQKLREGRKGLTEDAKKKIGAKNKIAMIQKWKDPEYRKSQSYIIAQSLHKQPNIPEKYIRDILVRNFPGEWKYTGDGSLIIEGYRPDFTNCNGRKEIIEIFGDYWHKRKKLKWHQTELGRIMACASVGFRCLVIWEYEIKELSEQEIVDKIRQWQKLAKCQ